MLLIKEIESKDIWDSFLSEVQPHTFLHSWNWGEFQAARGEKVWRLGIYENDILMGAALVIKISARRGTFLFCPHGPVTKHIAHNTKQELLKTLTEYLKILAKKENTSFIRISPLFTDAPENRNLFYALGFRKAPIHMHPERAWMVDITKPEEEILKGMRKQTRHCIRNAATAGVVVSQGANLCDLNLFYDIYKGTVARQDFVPFSREYLEKEFLLFAKDGQASIFLGKCNGEVISGAIVIFANGSGFYHHGASDAKFAKIPAAHILQWEIICEAKRRGLLWYNFWGIAPENKPQHPWNGLSLFKKGFGGFSEEYVPAMDLVLKSAYWVNFCIEKVRKWKRGL